MRRQNKRVISIVLVLSLLFTMFPVSLLAAGTGTPIDETTPDASSANKAEGKILSEVIEKRQANIKQFFKDDGTFEAAIYPQPVHYQENGQWKDIDNTLLEQTDEDNNPVLVNKNNDVKIRIAKNVKSNKLVRIQKDNFALSWSLLENEQNSQTTPSSSLFTGRINDVVANPQSRNSDKLNTLSDNERKKVLPNLSSTLDFTNAFTNVDLEYQLNSGQVKENIIVKSAIENPVFKFELNASNLAPKLQEDKSIIFYDTKDQTKAVFSMNPLFMYDSAKETSSNINITLEQGKNGYVLTITPDNAWLNDPARVYPVTIDPSIETPQNINAIHDTFVASIDTSNKWLNQYLRVGQTPGNVGLTRTYMRFDLPPLQTGDMIIGARLNLEYSLSQSSGGGQVNVHQVTSNFDYSNLYWTNQPSYNSLIEDYAIINGTSPDYYWDITKIAKNWYASSNNYGLMLEQDAGGSAYNSFYSSDWGDQYIRPSVLLSYVNNTGLESYWTYHSQTAGRAGTGYVNDYNGNFILVHNDVGMSGNRMPAVINHVFNSNDKAVNMNFGQGWRLNLSQTIIGPLAFKWSLWKI